MTSAMNKDLVLDFYKRVIGGRNSSLVDQYLSPDYIQHSPQIPDGPAGLKAAIDQMAALPAPAPGASPIRLAIADGDFVVLMLELNIRDTALRVVDLFRIADGKIAEHWDAMQAINEPQWSIPATPKRIFREKDIIVTQSEGSWQGDTYAMYDIYRIVDNVVSQHLPVRQRVPDNMPHGNGMI